MNLSIYKCFVLSDWLVGYVYSTMFTVDLFLNSDKVLIWTWKRTFLFLWFHDKFCKNDNISFKMLSIIAKVVILDHPSHSPFPGGCIKDPCDSVVDPVPIFLLWLANSITVWFFYFDHRAILFVVKK